MRKWNALLSMGILILFLIHGVMGGFQLMGIIPGGSSLLQVLAWVMAALIGIHTLIGCILTLRTLRAQKASGAAYFRENRLFWARRISGFAIMLTIAGHILVFLGTNDGVYRLSLFEGPQLALQILLVLAVAVHVITNVRPLLISFGIRGLREYVPDILFVLSVIMVFTAAAFLVYYLRWRG